MTAVPRFRLTVLVLVLVAAAACTAPCLRLETPLSREEKAAFCRAMKPYDPLFADAAARFGVPGSILAGVAYAGSGGAPQAVRAGLYGLLQMPREEFSRAREALAAQGVQVADDPLDPEANVLAGAWLLSEAFARVEAQTPRPMWRAQLKDWCRPLKAYAPWHDGVLNRCPDGGCLPLWTSTPEAFAGLALTWAEVRYSCH